MDIVSQIVAIIASLASLGGLISVIVNILKRVGVIKDGTSDMWYQGINLVVFIAVAIVYFLKTPVDWGNIDGYLKLLGTVLGFVIQMLGGQVTYTVIKGTPLIGFSFEKAKQRAAAKGN
jgi:hypothetical protein